VPGPGGGLGSGVALGFPRPRSGYGWSLRERVPVQPRLLSTRNGVDRIRGSKYAAELAWRKVHWPHSPESKPRARQGCVEGHGTDLL
jgi:hypothetical protein